MTNSQRVHRFKGSHKTRGKHSYGKKDAAAIPSSHIVPDFPVSNFKFQAHSRPVIRIYCHIFMGEIAGKHPVVIRTLIEIDRE